MPPGLRPLAVTALKNWRARTDFPGDGTKKIETALRDLSVVPCASGLCVVPIDTGAAVFAPGLVPQGPGKVITPADRARGAVGDTVRSLLHVADGTGGLTTVDLLVPGGTIDKVTFAGQPGGDGLDDRVLGSVPLPDPWIPGDNPPPPASLANAVQVAHYNDPDERPYTAVATAAQGLYLITEPLPLEVEKPRFKDCGYAVDGDVIGCEDQTLGQVVGVVGTPYTLHYQSDRTPGSRAVEFEVSGPVVPPNLAEYRVTVRVAGREIVKTYPADRES